MKKYGAYAELIETRDGFSAYVVQDEGPESPRTAFDNVGRMIQFPDREYSWGDEQLSESALTRQDGWKDVRREAIPRAYRRYLGAAVFLWIEHSQYDSSLRVISSGERADGFIYCTREQVAEEWGEDFAKPDGEGKTPLERADAYLRGEVETQSQWATGDVWGVIVESPKGEEVFAVWGYYGREDAETEARGELAREIAWEQSESEKIERMMHV